MLFWRMHRAARVLVTLRFHLGEIDAELAGIKELRLFINNVKGVWVFAGRIDKWHRRFLKVAHSDFMSLSLSGSMSASQLFIVLA